MSSRKAILRTGAALCAVVKGAKGFTVPANETLNNATIQTNLNNESALFSNSTAWTEDLMNKTHSNSTMFAPNCAADNSTAQEQIVSVIMNNNTDKFLPLHEYLSHTLDSSTFSNTNSTMSTFVNGTANATDTVVDFPCGKTLADGFDQQAPPTLREVSTRGPRLTNYDISGHHMHQVPVANFTGDNFVNNSTVIGTDFLTEEVFYDPEDLIHYDVPSNYTAAGNDGIFLKNNNNTCAHCEMDDNVADSVAVMSSFISGHMKENGTMNGLVAIVADVSTDLYNFTVANMTDTFDSFRSYMVSM